MIKKNICLILLVLVALVFAPTFTRPDTMTFKTENMLTVSNEPYINQKYTNGTYACFLLNISPSLPISSFTLLKSSFNISKNVKNVELYEVKTIAYEEKNDYTYEYFDNTTNQTKEKTITITTPKINISQTLAKIINTTKTREYGYCMWIDGNSSIGEEKKFSFNVATKSADPTISACNSTVNTPNGYYSLDRNIVNEGATCLTVEADNITIDCGGYNITEIEAVVSSGYYGILSTHYNTTVKNCNISYFSTGIYQSTENIYNFTNNTINITFSTSCVSSLSPCHAIFIASADYGEISYNRLTASQYALALNGGDYANISYNNITATNLYGLYIRSGTYANVWNNNINAPSSALTLRTTGGYHNITLNNISASVNYGVQLYASSNNNITNNKIYAETANSVYFSNSPCINNTISYNKIVSVGQYGVYCSAISCTNTSVIYNNISITSGGRGISFTTAGAGSNFSYNNITATEQNLYLTGSRNSTISYNNISSTGANAIYSATGRNNTFSYNNITSTANAIFLETGYGDNTIIYNRATCTSGYCIRISGVTNSTISYNNISSSSTYALYSYSGHNNTFSYNNITGTTSTLYLEVGNGNNTIIYNKATCTSGDCLLVSGTSNSNISYNNATHNGAVATRVCTITSSSQNNTFSYNNCTGTQTSQALYISNSRNNTIYANNLSSAGTTAQSGVIILNSDSTNNNLTLNIVNQTNTGDNTQHVLYINSKAQNNTFENNTFYSAASNKGLSPAINITNSSGNNTFIKNNITAYSWIWDFNTTEGLPNFTSNIYNSSTTGNIYYFPNGTGAWEVFDITCSGSAPCYADAGTARPLNKTTTPPYNFSGSGQPNDWHPYTENGAVASVCKVLSTPNSVETLVNNIWGVDNSCFNITGANITLNCNGYWLNGTNGAVNTNDVAVNSTAFNTTVKNCKIANWTGGIFITGDTSDYASITNNMINLTYAAGCSNTEGICNGVFIKEGDFANIDNNWVYSNQYAINIYSVSNSNTITNNNATANYYAILLTSSSHANISYNNASAITQYGIYLFSASNNNSVLYNNASSVNNAIYLTGSSNNTIQFNNATTSDTFSLGLGASSENNTILYNKIRADGNALHASSSTNNTFAYNNATTTNDKAISTTSITYSNYSNNILSSVSYSFFIDTSSNSNQISYNNITATTGYAIYLSTSVNNTIIYNNATAPYDAIFLSDASNNTLQYNNATATQDKAIYLYSQSMNNSIINNSLTAGSAYEAINITIGSGNNTFLLNNISAKRWVGDLNYTSAGTSFSSNNFNSSTAGNIYYFSNGTGAWSVFDITCSVGSECWADGGTSRPFNNTNVGNNWTGNGNDWHPYTTTGGAVSLACSNLATAGTTYTMTTNLSINGFNCFNITAPNITLNCAGYTITGNNSTGTVGVNSTQYNTTIKDCNILNFSAGIFIDGDVADYANITNNTINLTYSTSCTATAGICNGIFINASDNTTISGNTVSAYRFGINNYNYANGNTIIYNNATTFCTVITGSAIFISNSSNNNISYNNVSTAFDESFYLTNNTYNNIISYNKITNTLDFGLIIQYNSNNNSIFYNNISTGSKTIYIDASSNNNITLNNAIATSSKAISVSAFSANNSIINNSLTAGSSYEAINITINSGNNTFLLNNISAKRWVGDLNYTSAGTSFSSNNFNSTNTGNIYYFPNGTASWSVFDITCSVGSECWADGGTSRPFNNTNVGNNWTDNGNDWFPYTLISGGADTCTPPVNPCGNWTINLADNCNIYNWSFDMTSGWTCPAGIYYINTGYVYWHNSSFNASTMMRNDSTSGKEWLACYADGGACSITLGGIT